MDFFRRVDRWLMDAPASLVVLTCVCTGFLLLFVASCILILLSDLRTTPRQIEIYIDPPKVQIPKKE